MALGLPIVNLRGTVRRVSIVNVPTRSPVTNESGAVVREARPGYEMVELTVDAGLAGFDPDAGPTTLIYRLSDGQFKGLDIPNGSAVDCLARPFISWQGNAPRRYPTVRFALVSEKVPTTARLSSGSHAVASGS